MRIPLILFLTIISSVATMPEASAAAKPQVVCSNAKGAIVVRTGRCKKSETKLSLASLATNAVSLAQIKISALQGPQGPQGVQGPQGPKGDTGSVGATGNPAGFDVGGCYSLSSQSQAFDFPADSTVSKSLTCNFSNGVQDFLLNSAFITLPPSNVTKPFVQTKLLSFDSTNKYPVGITYTSRQALIVGAQGHNLGIFIVCCPR